MQARSWPGLFSLDALQSENYLDTADLHAVCTRRVPVRSAMEAGGAGWPPHAPVKTGIWKAPPSASHVSQVDTQRAARLPFTLLHTQTLPEKPPNAEKARPCTAAQKLTRHRLRCRPVNSLSCVRGSSHRVRVAAAAGLALTSSSSLPEVD